MKMPFLFKRNNSTAAAYAWFYSWVSFEMHHFRQAPACTSCPVLVRINSCGSTWVSRLTSTAWGHIDWGGGGVGVVAAPRFINPLNLSRCCESTPVWPAPKGGKKSTFCDHLFLTWWLYTAWSSSPLMAKVFNYWLVVRQKVLVLEIKRQLEAIGIIYGSGAIFPMNNQRYWLYDPPHSASGTFLMAAGFPDTFYSPE